MSAVTQGRVKPSDVLQWDSVREVPESHDGSPDEPDADADEAMEAAAKAQIQNLMTVFNARRG